MSLPIGPGDGKAKVDPLLVSSTTLDQQQQQQQQPGSSSPWRTLDANNSDSLLVQNNNKKKNKLDVAWFWWDDDDDQINPEESDEDMFTVPDVEAMSSITANTNAINNKKNPDDHHHTTGFPGKRRRGRNPVDKEYRRLKRLLRNRVSAQQARERKKVYVNDLESRAGELENSNSKLEEKISTLINENTMLRKVLMNTRPKVDESIEQKQDQLSKS